jgi:hypothetical protein
MATEDIERSSGAEPLKERAERDERGRFTKGNPHRWGKGQSGNTAGRRDAMTDALRRRLNDQHDDALIDEACAGSVRAVELIIQRLDGKVPNTSTIDINVSRSEYQIYEARVTELMQIADERGMPISRGKAVRLISVTDPRVLSIMGEVENE